MIDDVVLLGMGGSSLAPEVMRRFFEAGARARPRHDASGRDPPARRAARPPADALRLRVEVGRHARDALAHRLLLGARSSNGDNFAAITDPGSALEGLAEKRGFGAVFPGEPTIGGRYSALSPFGIVPLVLMGVDAQRLLLRAQEMAEACRIADGNPGLELGQSLGANWLDGRDKVVFEDVNGFGLWAEQLLAESTGKEDKGLVPAPGESPDGPDRQPQDVRIPDPYELGQEFYRWEFATAVAGSILGINPFDQPNVQAAKDKTNEVLAAGEPNVEPEGSLDELLGSAAAGDYVCIQAFIDPAREAELEPLVARAHETGCVVTKGLGPRYLHSTGQLHKGGPNTGVFVQVVDDTGPELAIPGQKFGFARLIKAQAAGDLASLKDRGRRVARVRLEEL